MTMRFRPATLASIVRAAMLAAGTLGPVTGLDTASAQGWPSFARDSFHRATSPVASQLPQAILWSTTVDLNPPFFGILTAHYGSPVITPNNTVIVPVKVGFDDTFRIE